MLQFFLSIAFADVPGYTPQTGDIIAHTSQSSQSKMIQVGTMSKYSHVGVIFVNRDQVYVFEATGRTKYSTLENFIKRGEDGKFTILRYDEQGGLTDKQKNALRRTTPKYKGSRYDLAFKWSDDKMYCSELVWKMYEDIGITLSKTRTMRSYNIWIIENCSS